MRKTKEGWDEVRARRTYSALLIVLILAGCGGSEFPSSSTRMVDVLGNPTKVLTLRLEEREEGEPVLFVMGGGGAPMESWGGWLDMIAALAPVVTYDRPGIGGSPFDGVDPTPRRVVEHAHEVLTVLDVPPPYILVGWSWGGPLIRYYAGAHPADVVGLVYLDPSDMTATPDENIGAASDEERRERQAELDARMEASDRSPGIMAEYRAATRFFRSPVEDRDLPDDLDVPTSVVLATRVPSIRDDAPSFQNEDYFRALFARRVRQFGDWAVGRPHTVLFIATSAGHAVHRDDPALALAAVRHVAEAVR